MDEPLVNFDNILNQAVESVEKPPPIPAGHYVCSVGKHEFANSRTKGEPMVTFEFNVINPSGDVDQTILAEAGGIEKAQRFPLNRIFMLTAEHIWRLRDFLEKACKLPVTGGLSFTEALPQTSGKQVLVKVGHRTVDDNIYPQVEAILPTQEA